MRKISFDISKLIGKKFGRLTVIKELPKQGYNRFVECNCDCGKVKKVGIFHLENGHTRSCGCIKKESFKQIREQQIKETGLLPFGQSSLNTMFQKYAANAEKRGVEFRLSKNKFESITKQNCHYCGEPPNTIKRANHVSKDFILANGIDRVNSSLGYTEENSVPCCKFCNSAKKDYDLQDFLIRIKKIYQHNYGTS